MLLKLEHTWKETLEFAPTHRTLCNPRLSKGSILKKGLKVNILGVWSKSGTLWFWLLEWNCLIFEKTGKTTTYTMKNNPLIIYHMESLSYGFHESPFRRIINQRGFVFTYKCILKRHIDDLLYDVKYFDAGKKVSFYKSRCFTQYSGINQDII